MTQTVATVEVMPAQNGLAAQNGTATQKETVVNPGIDPKVAISPNSADDVPGLLEKIAAQGKAFEQSESHSRSKLLETARNLVYALETPREAMIRYCWGQWASYASIETAVETRLFEAMAKDEKPKTVTELAEITGVDSVILGRIMKHLCAVGVLSEAGPDVYRSTGFSKAMTIQKYGDGFPCITGCVSSAVCALPEHLKNINYQAPANPKDCAFQVGYKTPNSFFEHLGANPSVGAQFANHMSAYHQGRTSWMDKGFYPVQENLIDGSKGEGSVFLVDVGGSQGHDLEEFRSKWPGASGRFILQDLPNVIEDVKNLDKGIEPTVHDFFTEQPVKGARAYFMHSILHDWPDDSSQKILSRLAEAMTPGYSKILINENVIPSTDAYWESTALDIIMMSLFASQERTEKQWHKLIESAGLKIVGIWTAEKGAESLIECELA